MSMVVLVSVRGGALLTLENWLGCVLAVGNWLLGIEEGGLEYWLLGENCPLCRFRRAGEAQSEAIVIVAMDVELRELLE